VGLEVVLDTPSEGISPLGNDNEEEDGLIPESEVNHIVDEEDQEMTLDSEVNLGALTDDDISVKVPIVPETETSGEKLKSKKTKKVKRPWTLEDYKAYKSQRSESKAKDKLDMKKNNPNLYAFLADDIVENAESLYYDFDSGYDTEGSNVKTDTVNTGKAAGKWTQTTTVQEEEPVKEEASRTHWQWDKDGNESQPWVDNLPPSPMVSFTVASIAINDNARDKPGRDWSTSDLSITSWEETKKKDKDEWKNVPTRKKVAAPMIFEGSFGGHICTILWDNGSGTQIMSPSFARKHEIPMTELASKVRLTYGDGKQAIATYESKEAKVGIGNLSFVETFTINPEDIPGVDLILGKSFQDRTRAEIRYPKEDDKFFNEGRPYVRFCSGEQIYTRESLMGDISTTNMQYISSDEAYEFLRKEQKTNHTLDDIEFYKISVQKEMEVKGEIKSSTVKKKIPAEVQALLDKYNILRDQVPVDEILSREDPSYHSIPLVEGATPVKVPPIPVSADKLDIMRSLIAELVKIQVLEKGNLNSPWGAPVLLLRKAGNRPGLANAWRLVCDYRGLNAVSKKNTWSPPAVRSIMDDLVGCKYFSKTDNVGGFYQLPILPIDKEKTTFRIRTENGYEAYQFNVSSLGLQGCPGSYQSFMESVIEGLTGVHVYLDDIVYFSQTWEEHLVILEAAFKRFAERKVFLHPLKCEFGMTEMEYLGLIVSKNRIQISEEKIAALKAYKVPDSHQALMRFLGFANYLSAFVPHYAATAAPLTDLLKGGSGKKTKFIWTASCQQAFDSLKDKLTKAVGLGIPDKRGDLVLETDASGVGIGAVLYQFTNGKLTPLWFLSRKLNKAEKNYSSRDREALAVVYALVKMEAYLMQKPFILYSDHESLIYFQSQKDLKGRDWRWVEILANYSFEQRYRKGETMVAPDALSRAFDDRADPIGAWTELEHTREARLHPQVDTLNANVPIHLRGKLAQKDDMTTVPVSHIKTDLAKADVGVTKKGNGIDINKEIQILLDEDSCWGKLPASVRANTPLARSLAGQDAHLYSITARVFGDLTQAIASAYSQDTELKEIHELVQKPLEVLNSKERSKCKNFSFEDGLLYFTPSPMDGPRLVIPKNQGNGLRMTVLYESHDAVWHVAHHQKTLDRLRKRYWWPSMVRDCAAYCDTCKACRLYASTQKRPDASMEARSVPENRWEVIHADWITDLPVTRKGHNAILVVHDSVTKYAYLIPACNTDTAEETANKLFAQVFCLHGLPTQLVSDRDKLFTSKFFAQLMRILNVKQVMGTSYQHDFNGAAERLNRTVEVMLRHVVSDHPDRDFEDYLPQIQWAYNTTVHDSIRVSPFFANWGYEPRLPLPLKNLQELPDQHKSLKDYVEHQQNVLAKVREALLEAKFLMELHDRRNKSKRIPDVIVKGDRVFLSTRNIGQVHVSQTAQKLRKRFIGPFKVLEKVSEFTYLLELPDKMKRLHPIFHVSLLWKEKPTTAELEFRLSDSITTDDATAIDNLTDQVLSSDLPEQTLDEEGNPIYLVEKLLKRRKAGKGYEYQVKWLGYPDTENTWEPSKNILGKAARAMMHKLNSENK